MAPLLSPLLSLCSMPAPRLAVPRRDQRLFFGDAEAERMFDAALARLAALGATLSEIDYAPLAEAAAVLYSAAGVAERTAAIDEFLAGRLSRRELLRYASVIGLSLAGGGLFATPQARAQGAPGAANATVRVAHLTPTGAIDPLTVGDAGGLALLVQTGSALGILGYIAGIDGLAILGTIAMLSATIRLACPLLKPAANDNPLMIRTA